MEIAIINFKDIAKQKNIRLDAAYWIKKKVENQEWYNERTELVFVLFKKNYTKSKSKKEIFMSEILQIAEDNNVRITGKEARLITEFLNK